MERTNKKKKRAARPSARLGKQTGRLNFLRIHGERRQPSQGSDGQGTATTDSRQLADKSTVISLFASIAVLFLYQSESM